MFYPVFLKNHLVFELYLHKTSHSFPSSLNPFQDNYSLRYSLKESDLVTFYNPASLKAEFWIGISSIPVGVRVLQKLGGVCETTCNSAH